MTKPIRYWCNTHSRRAKEEYPNHEGYACVSEFNGRQGWIMIPCQVIDCEEVGIEIIDDIS